MIDEISEIVLDSYVLYLPSDLLHRAATKGDDSQESIFVKGLIEEVKLISKEESKVLVLPSETFDNGLSKYRISKIY